MLEFEARKRMAKNSLKPVNVFRIYVDDPKDLAAVNELKALLVARGLSDTDWILSMCRKEVAESGKRLVKSGVLTDYARKHWDWVVDREILRYWRNRHWTEGVEYHVDRRGGRATMSYDFKKVVDFMKARVPSESVLERQHERERQIQREKEMKALEDSGPKVREYTRDIF